MNGENSVQDFNRREFLRTSLGGVLASTVLCAGGCSAAKRSIKEIGLQLYTVRDAIARDWRGALRCVADIGYDTIESAELFGGDAESHLAFLKEIGLKNISGGGSMADLQTNLQKVIDDSLAVGRKYVVCFWPWSDTFTAETPDVWRKIAGQLNVFGEQCRKHDLVFAYHNHAVEFAPGDVEQPYDFLLNETDPDLVHMEVDLYWMTKAGKKPIDYMKKYPGRFPLWHIKDMADDKKKSFACVGDGIIDFAAIFEHAETAGLQHIFVEQDQPNDAMSCIESSYTFLKSLRY